MSNAHAESSPVDPAVRSEQPMLEESTRERLGDMIESLRKLAHDINNPLTALLGRAQLLRGLAGDDPKLIKQAETIEESGLRIAELVQEVSRELRAGTKLLEAEKPDS